MKDFKQLMKNAGVTYRELGALTNLEFTDIFQFVKNHRSFPIHNIQMVAYYLHVPTSDLIDDDFRFTNKHVQMHANRLLLNFELDFIHGLYDQVDATLVNQLRICSAVFHLQSPKALNELQNVVNRLTLSEKESAPTDNSI
jgi:transcriptional regulator with XRE-family HTH domain